MSFAKILVPLTGSPTDELALATGFAAAIPFHSHVAALFVHPDPREVTPYVYSGGPIAPQIIQAVIDGQKKLAEEATEAARSAMTAAAKDFGATILPAPARDPGLSCSFHSRLGFIPHAIADAARFSDLVVFKPAQKDERPEFAAAIAETLVQVNRPVLLSAHKRPANKFRKIAIGWDGRNAAMHAISASLPYLQIASRVEILVVGDETVPGCKSLREYLSLYGVEASEQHVTMEGKSVAASLMGAAANAGADLLVMGGYGHSHLRETLLGGVTLEVISDRSMPVFLMH